MVSLSWILVLLIFCTHILSKTIPSFRVVAPQTICEEAENEQPFVTITLFPHNKEKLKYNFQIFFKNLGNYQSQRRTLELWKFIRSLEYKINVRDNVLLSETNFLTINKNELTPGIAYVFHVVGTAQNGIASKGQNFTIKFLKGDVMNTISNNINLILLAPEYTLASIPFVAVAKVEFCPHRSDYYFQWNIPGLDKQFQKNLLTPRSTLSIPSGALKVGQYYQAEVSVLQANDSRKIAGTAFPFKVLSQGFEIFIIPTSINAGQRQPIGVEIIINDFDGNNLQELEISWVLANELQKAIKCNGCVNKTRIETSIDTVGNYTITAKAKKGAIIKTITSDIIISAALLYFEFFSVSTPSITVTQGFNFNIIIKNLIPKCKGEWMSVKGDGFELLTYLKDELKPFKVNNLEQNYLSELSDYGNSTTSKTFPLTIPRSEWIRENTKYKFRLEITCPSPFSQEPYGTVQSWFEFNLFTKAPPEGAPLEVRPMRGIALKTIFQFATNNVKGVKSNLPFHYNFFYKVDNLTVSVGNYYDYRSAETILPYSDSPIQTFYEVCDVSNACSTIHGPSVTVSLDEVTALEVQHKLYEIANAFRRLDFFHAQTLMLMSALSYGKRANADIYNNFKNISTNILSIEIDRLYERRNTNSVISNDDIYKFVRFTKEMFEVLDVTNADMIRKLLDLLESAIEEANPSERFRRKRDLKKFSDAITDGIVAVDSDFAQLSLELMERLFKSIDEHDMPLEKRTILEKINKLLIKLCESNVVLSENIETNLAIIDIWKRKGNDIIGTRFPVKHFNKPQIGYLAINMADLQKSNGVCVTLVQFPEDYFASTKANSSMFYIQLFDNNSPYSEKYRISNAIEFLVPTSMTSQTCLMRVSDSWVEEPCKSIHQSDSIKCSCNSLGYLKLSPGVAKAMTSTASKTSTTDVTHTTVGLNDEDLSSYSNNFQIGSTTSTVTKTLSNSPSQNTTSTPTKASIAAYIIPLVGLILIATVIGASIAYIRRRKNGKLIITGIENIEPREQLPGLKYGRFHDEHLLVGVF